MNNRGDPWDSRPSTDSITYPADQNEGRYNHIRQDSAASVEDVLSQPYQQPKDSLSTYNYGYQDTYPPQSNPYFDRQPSKGSALAQPSYAYTQEPGPTPKYSDPYYGSAATDLDQPARSQAHPVEFR